LLNFRGVVRKGKEMAKSSYIIALAFFSIAVSCLKPPNSPTGENQQKIIPNSADFFPLKKGYIWEYTGTGRVHEIKWTVVSDTSINGKTYQAIETRYNNSASEKILVRKDVDGNILQNKNGKDAVWFDFSKADSTTYSFPFVDSTNCKVTVQKNFKAVLPDSTVVPCTVFFFDAPSIIDEEMSYVFSPHYGIVSISSFWYSANLVRAKLN
jgi:hypothetical protein